VAELVDALGSGSSVHWTWFLLVVIGEPNIYHDLGCFTRKWEVCGVVSDCEELVEVTSLG